MKAYVPLVIAFAVLWLGNSQPAETLVVKIVHPEDGAVFMETSDVDLHCFVDSLSSSYIFRRVEREQGLTEEKRKSGLGLFQAQTNTVGLFLDGQLVQQLQIPVKDTYVFRVSHLSRGNHTLLLAAIPHSYTLTRETRIDALDGDVLQDEAVVRVEILGGVEAQSSCHGERRTFCGELAVGDCMLRQHWRVGLQRRRRAGTSVASLSLLVIGPATLAAKLADGLKRLRSVKALVWEEAELEERLRRVADADIIIRFAPDGANLSVDRAVLSAMPVGGVLVEPDGASTYGRKWAECAEVTLKTVTDGLTSGHSTADSALVAEIESAVDASVEQLTRRTSLVSPWKAKLVTNTHARLSAKVSWYLEASFVDGSSPVDAQRLFDLGLIEGLGCPGRILFFDVAWGQFGRLNNLLLTLGNVLYIADTTDRTVLLHGTYHEADIETIVDVGLLRGGTPCVFTPADLGTELFEAAYEALSPTVVDDPHKLYENAPDHVWLRNDDKLFYSMRPTSQYMDHLFQFLHLGDSSVNEVVDEYINDVLGAQRRYTAVHLRSFAHEESDVRCLEFANEEGLPASTCLPEYDYIRKIKEHAGDDLIFVLSDHQNLTLDQTFDDREDVRTFPTGRCSAELGEVRCVLVDMEIAVHANTFVGSHFSSFSSNVVRMRRARMGKASMLTIDAEYIRLTS